MSTSTTEVQTVDVTSVMADIDMAKGLRDRIATMKRQLEQHETAIKDVLGPATQGTDAAGNVVVQCPIRNRTNLVAAKVKAILSEADYAACQNVTSYRPLLFED